MSDAEAPRLLARERAELNGVVEPLREGRRVVAFLVCEAPLRLVVLAYLREKSGVAVPEPVRVAEPGQMVDALVEAAERGPGEVRSLLIGGGAEEVLRALNWNREKLRRGASVLVWIEGVDGLRALRATAPDAYSFRDVMVVVRGEEPVEVVVPAEEPVEVQLERIPYGVASTLQERAEAAIDLASALLKHEFPEEAQQVCESMLEASRSLPEREQPVPVDRAALYGLLALAYQLQGHLARAWQMVNNELVDATPSDVMRWSLFSALRTPIGLGYHNLRALVETLRSRDDLAGFVRQLRDIVRYEDSGDVNDIGNGAVSAPDGLVAPSFAEMKARHLRGEGYLSAAEQQARVAHRLYERTRQVPLRPALALAECVHLEGEVEAARYLFRRVVDSLRPGACLRPVAVRRLAVLEIEAGDTLRGFSSLRSLIREGASSSRDGHLYQACVSYVSSLRAAHDAGRLSPVDLADADAELAAAQDVALSLTPNDDPPWYSILFPGLRAEVLSLRPDRLSEAISLSTTSVERARTVWPDAAPMHARMLLGYLVSTERYDDTLAALAVAEPEAEAQRNRGELIRLRALAIVVLARTSAPSADIDAKLAALRATLDETGAPRIVAETLQELALLLPPEASHPDPLDLLDEAHALFVEMPMPAQEARCLEAMGDVLLARGDTANARRRYLAAKGNYENYGFGLRLPLLTTKLERLG